MKPPDWMPTPEEIEQMIRERNERLARIHAAISLDPTPWQDIEMDKLP